MECPELKLKLLSKSEVKIKAIQDVVSSLKYTVYPIEVIDPDRPSQPIVIGRDYSDYNAYPIVNAGRKRIDKYLSENPDEDSIIISVENGIVYLKSEDESYDVCFVIIYNPVTNYERIEESFHINIEPSFIEKFLGNQDKYDTVGRVIEEESGFPHNDWATGYTKGKQTRCEQIKSAITQMFTDNCGTDKSMYRDLEIFSKAHYAVKYTKKYHDTKYQIIAKDIAPLYKNFNLFYNIVEKSVIPIKYPGMNKIDNFIKYFIGIDSNGYVLATTYATIEMAREEKCGVLLMKKRSDKMFEPYHVDGCDAEMSDLSEVEPLEIDLTGKNVVICGGIVCFGNTAKSAKDCLEKAGAKVIAFAFVTDIKEYRSDYRALLGDTSVCLCLS